MANRYEIAMRAKDFNANREHLLYCIGGLGFRAILDEDKKLIILPDTNNGNAMIVVSLLKTNNINFKYRVGDFISVLKYKGKNGGEVLTQDDFYNK